MLGYRQNRHLVRGLPALHLSLKMGEDGRIPRVRALWEWHRVSYIIGHSTHAHSQCTPHRKNVDKRILHAWISAESTPCQRPTGTTFGPENGGRWAYATCQSAVGVAQGIIRYRASHSCAGPMHSTLQSRWKAHPSRLKIEFGGQIWVTLCTYFCMILTLVTPVWLLSVPEEAVKRCNII
jgi:hypothetical protein